MARTAIILFNLGGPDRLDAVRPFLFNLFNDPAIIALPGPVRWLVAALVARRRTATAQAFYAEIGGASPLLSQTEAQARALLAELERAGGDGEVRVFVAMRYWHPLIAEVAQEVAAFAPEEVVLVPLYPQFSTTTTGSSLAEWRAVSARAGIAASTRAVCCYPVEPAWVAAQAAAIGPAWQAAAAAGPAPGAVLGARLAQTNPGPGRPIRVAGRADGGRDRYQCWRRWRRADRLGGVLPEQGGTVGVDRPGHR